MLTLSLQIVKDPRVQEQAPSKLLRLLLLFSIVHSSNAVELVDEMARRGLARIEGAKDNNVDVSLLLGDLTKKRSSESHCSLEGFK